MNTVSMQLPQAETLASRGRDVVRATSARPRPAGANKNNVPTWETIEAQDSHLWMLAIGLMFILGISLLTVMFPSVFWTRNADPVAPQAFVGVSVLMVLMLVYLVQRQCAVRALRSQLLRARANFAIAEEAATVRAYELLPGSGQFHDMLAMEFRRASVSSTSLTVAMITFPTADHTAEAAVLLHGMLRRGESMYRVADDAIGLLLPGTTGDAACDFVIDAQARCGSHMENAQTDFLTYPSMITSCSEIERWLKNTVDGE